MNATVNTADENAGARTLEAIRRLPPSGALDDTSVETFYSIGYNALASRQYDDAGNIFGMLTAVRPSDPRFVAGLGLAFKGIGDYDNAAMLLALAGGLDTGNPRHYIPLAEVLIAQEKREQAMVVLDAAVVFASMRKELDEVRVRAEALRELLRKNGG